METLPPLLSHSQLSILQLCPRRYYWRYLANLQLEGDVTLPALWSRSLVHPSLASL